ncbi:MAG: hypothetical protein LBR43_00555 [Spiroplasmataceae bacterium]|jgi:hypothetical protein|nr:hypothetical protein [Spiroplasmataceae bacterium]
MNNKLNCSICFKYEGFSNKEDNRLTQIKWTIICHSCIFKNELKEILSPSTKCHDCKESMKKEDPKHEVDKSTVLAQFIFDNNESEKIIRCSKCYKRTKCLRKLLFFCFLPLLGLWIRMFKWGDVKDAWKDYHRELISFGILSLGFILLLYLLNFYDWKKNKN